MDTLANYAIVWFEGDDIFTLVDNDDKTIRLTEEHAKEESYATLRNEKDIEDAQDDLRYAIHVDLLESTFGWVA